jgi:phytoene dehydrogenase-like protein
VTARHDAVVVGAGPNGLSAAITLAREGLDVLVLEGQPTLGGGARSGELTLPGYVHDVCSAIHPLAAASPFFRTLPLAALGLEWIQPAAPLAHPFDDGTAAVLERSLDETCLRLGSDGPSYRRLFRPLVDSADAIFDDILRPVRFPRHVRAALRFGLSGVRSASALACRRFAQEPARALFAGLAAHSMLPLEQAPSAAFGLVLAMAAHTVGWPLPRGGAQQISNALAAHLRSLRGEIVTDCPLTTLQDLPAADIVMLDVTPRQLIQMAGSRLTRQYRGQLERYRYGPGAFKMDWAMDGPIPWKCSDCARAGTVHLGGTFDEIARAERQVADGQMCDRPFVLLAQPSRFDDSRAPPGRHTAWAYCHVPNGSTFEMTEHIESQIERFAPGFRDRILARNVLTPAQLERRNSNYVGGDISGGANDFRQMFARPVLGRVPYSTGTPGLFICSSSTPPGAGVHGLCGYFAALAALRWRRSKRSSYRG